MLWGGRCHEASRRLDAALAAASRADGRLKSAALDVINQSVEPGIEPYTPDRIGEALASVTRKYQEAHRRGS